MSLSQYFLKLGQQLKHLTAREREEAVEFYTEFASEAGIDSYEAMVSRFGPPRELAAVIYAETAEREIKGETENSKKNVSRGLWIGIAALAAFPFSFSAAVVIACVCFALLVSVGSILLSLVVAACAVAAAGLWCLLHSFSCLLPLQLSALLMGVGGFLVLTPIGCASLILLVKLIRKTLTAVIAAITNHIKRRTTYES